MVNGSYSSDFDGDGVVFDFAVIQMWHGPQDMQLRFNYGGGEFVQTIRADEAADFLAHYTGAMHALLWASPWA